MVGYHIGIITDFRSHIHGPVRTGAPASPLTTQSLIYRPWIKLLSKHDVRCFSKIYWLARWKNRRSQAGCGIDRETIGWCSMSMAHGKLLANELYLARLIARQHNAG